MLLIGQSPGFSEAADHHLTMRRAGGVARIAASDMPRPATRVEVGG